MICKYQWDRNPVCNNIIKVARYVYNEEYKYFCFKTLIMTVKVHRDNEDLVIYLQSHQICSFNERSSKPQLILR